MRNLDFEEFILNSNLTNNFIPLPIFHQTDNFCYNKIVKARYLIPQQCDVFDKEIIYFFYGKSSFWKKNMQNINYTDNHLPIVFVLNLEKIFHEFKKIDAYPFDTGIFVTHNIEKEPKVTDFKLTLKDFEDINKYLNIIYEDFNDYIDNNVENARLLESLKTNNSGIYGSVYKYLINWYNNKKINEIGRQAHTFEIQVFTKIELSKFVEGIITPQGYFCDSIELDSALNIPNLYHFEYNYRESFTNDKIKASIDETVEKYINLHYLNKNQKIILENGI